jgi:predicted DNA-binding transcriptional regulator AlpA
VAETSVNARELAKRLGMSTSRFYRSRDRLHVIGGLPRPLVAGGRLTFDRASIDDYFSRNQVCLPTRARQRS